MTPNNKYAIGYYLVTDIQHIPPVIRLYPHLGGIVITKNKEIYNQINDKYSDYNVTVIYCRSNAKARELIKIHKIRVMIYPSYHVLYGGKAIEIFHGGLSDKNYVESVKILVYDYVLFPGEKTKDKVKQSGYLKYVPKWKIIGYPKFDPLINSTLDVKPLFNNSRKTILYAPTWISNHANFRIIKFSEHGESSLYIWAKEIVKALHNEYNIIIKYHSRIYREQGDIYEQIDNLIKELGAEDNIKVRIDDNILPFMYQSDLMISDISTACYEWFHFNKPIVFANPAPEYYKVSDDIGSNTFAWQAGDVINKQENILTHVKRNLAEDVYQSKRNEIFKYTVHLPDGNATKRQVDAILKFYKKYKKRPYWWLYITSYLTRRIKKKNTKLINWYYQKFRKIRVGK